VRVRPLFAYVAKHNFGSLRVLQKCGFVICGEDQIVSGNPGGVIEAIYPQTGGVIFFLERLSVRPVGNNFQMDILKGMGI